MSIEQATPAPAAPAVTLAQLPTRMHHHAFVVRDQERTRQFYEDVLGLPLVATWCEVEDVRGKVREYCHTFFGLGDGSALAFFQFVDPADYDELGARARPGSLEHIALHVTPATQQELIERLDRAGQGHRLIDHGYCRSLYVNDPDGLSVEFTADDAEVDEINRVRRADAHAELRRWLAGDRSSNNAWRRGH
jgi:catechol 2,3-dioxygenase-like lactoylglutathione lyase family enzyme